MGTVLYEMKPGYLSFFLIPILLLCIIPFYTKIRARICANSGKEYTDELRNGDLAISLFAWLFLFVAILIAFWGQSDMYKTAIDAWKSGNYEIVEGYVENYTFPAKAQTYESFEINGVRFEYSSSNQVPGYHTTANHGGVVTGNGQYLKIGYIYYNATYGNIILYIEQIQPSS